APAGGPPPGGPPSNVRGTVEKFGDGMLTVKSREGPSVTVKVAANVPISGMVKRSLSEIKAGDFIASTSVKGSDGKLHALEVHIFSEAQRNVVPQGQTPYDLAPQSLMTNAIVEGIASAPQGQTFKVTYKGETTEVVVAPDTPVVSAVPGDASLLKPGAAVVVAARKGDDGSLTAMRISAEKDGVKPPM
ncbi:MAG TPA: hypothetical protein VN802_07305, partial [Stellaceae bacterium]|nr:hypothetical protein [Stellaceae bacterium]